jgi:hypothetical protein
MAKDAIINLSIDEAGTPPLSTFLYHVMVGGEVVASNLSLSPEDSRAVREISRRYNGLFEGAFVPRLAAERLDAIGAELRESRQRDRGASLIEAAFADPAPDPDKV